MLRHCDDVTEAVFIHNVKSQDCEEFYASVTIPERKRLILFNTYAKAAYGALSLGMIDAPAAARVASAVLEEVLAIDWGSAKKSAKVCAHVF